MKGRGYLTEDTILIRRKNIRVHLTFTEKTKKKGGKKYELTAHVISQRRGGTLMPVNYP